MRFQVEHEVHGMRDRLFAQPLVNRNPARTARDYAPGWEAARRAMAGE